MSMAIKRHQIIYAPEINYNQIYLNEFMKDVFYCLYIRLFFEQMNNTICNNQLCYFLISY